MDYTKLSILNSKLSNLDSLGDGGTPIAVDEFCRLNLAIFELTNELFDMQTSSSSEEAGLCMALLQGLTTTIYSSDDKQKKIQCILDRSVDVLALLDNSFLKCGLLLVCYQVVEDRELLEEAKEVIMSWGGRELTEEEKVMMERWNEIANNRKS